MGRMKEFDRKFGAHFISNLPTCAGIYCIYDSDDVLIYVGKAKNLRRRLSQYRLAKRKKRDRKKRKIIQRASQIKWEALDSELEADLREIRLIQSHRPKLNVAGAFSFLYPMVGIHCDGGLTYFCMTTQREAFPQFDFHGAYRSRELTGEAFFALMKLMGFIGHPLSQKQMQKMRQARYSYTFGFRRLPSNWAEKWTGFFKGHSREALEELSLKLLSNAGARAKASEVEESLGAIKMFWEEEASRLAEVISATGHLGYPISQKERDPLFLQYRRMQNST